MDEVQQFIAEKIQRAMDLQELRSQLQIVFEATRQTAAASVGTVVPAVGQNVAHRVII